MAVCVRRGLLASFRKLLKRGFATGIPFHAETSGARPELRVKNGILDTLYPSKSECQMVWKPWSWGWGSSMRTLRPMIIGRTASSQYFRYSKINKYYFRYTVVHSSNREELVALGFSQAGMTLDGPEVRQHTCYWPREWICASDRYVSQRRQSQDLLLATE